MIEGSKIKKIKDLLAKEKDVLFGYLFGSALSKFFAKESDIDIAIFFKEYDIQKHLDLIHKLQKILDQKVDIVVLNRAKNIYLLEEIISKGLVLKDDPKRFDFEIYKNKEINDFKISKRLIYGKD